jgi:hypothetical protein
MSKPFKPHTRDAVAHSHIQTNHIAAGIAMFGFPLLQVEPCHPLAVGDCLSIESREVAP